MTTINLNIREQTRVFTMMNQSTILLTEDDCDAELSFDDLKAVNGGFWPFKATKTAAAVTNGFNAKFLISIMMLSSQSWTLKQQKLRQKSTKLDGTFATSYGLLIEYLWLFSFFYGPQWLIPGVKSSAPSTACMAVFESPLTTSFTASTQGINGEVVFPNIALWLAFIQL